MGNDTRQRLARFFSRKVLWVAVCSVLGYVILASSLPTQPFLEFIRILQATAAVIVVVAFSGDAWESLTREHPERSDCLIIGSWLQHVSVFWTGFWLLAYRLGGRQDWMLNLMWWGFASAWLSALASTLYVYPVGVLRGGEGVEEIPPARLRIAGLFAAVGVFSILVVLATQPDVRGLLDIARPWMW